MSSAPSKVNLPATPPAPLPKKVPAITKDPDADFAIEESEEFPARPRIIRKSETIHLPSGNDRVPIARARVEKTLRELFAEAGLQYPPERLFIRAFKRESELELWAAPALGGFRLVTTYEVTCNSGGPGPKRREGDGQTPEGFYVIDRLNPKSNFHLSLGLSYPNASDRILSDREKPGHDIFIHGRASSIGCLPVGDDRVEEVFIAVTDTAQRPVQVHVFPARMDAADWGSWRDAASTVRSDLGSFWDNLRPGWEYFERYRQLPKIGVAADGSYEYDGHDNIAAHDLRQ